MGIVEKNVGMTMDDALVEARSLLLTGDADGLSELLDEDTTLVHRRFETAKAPYDGYFHGATLLHHVAGNPRIAELPDAIVSLAGELVARGAEVDAVTRRGPSQPDDIGWTTLGLVATSALARASGHQRALMDLLIDAGADLDARNGGCLMGALYYGEAEAAEHLARRGARVDLIAAAGLGDLPRMREILDGDDGGSDGRSLATVRLAHYSLVPWPDDAGRADLLGLALIYAALHGRLEAIRMLIERGVDPNHRPPFDHQATALHWAAAGNRPEAVRALLDAGADPEIKDQAYRSTPAGWARHMGRSAALEALERGRGHPFRRP